MSTGGGHDFILVLSGLPGSSPLGNSELMTSTVICLHTQLSSQLILTRLNTLQNWRPRITLVSIIALLDYIGMGTSYTYLAYNIHRLLTVSYHFNVIARLKFQFAIKLLVQLVIYIQGHRIDFSTSILFATYEHTIYFNIRKHLCGLNLHWCSWDCQGRQCI